MSLTPDQQAEIDALRSTPSQTLRVVAPGAEKHLYSAVPVLDHGGAFKGTISKNLLLQTLSRH